MLSCEFEYFGQNSAEIYFQSFSDEPYALLLDSGRSEQGNSRFDLILVQPEKVLLSKNNQNTAFNLLNSTESIVDDCFACLNEWLEIGKKLWLEQSESPNNQFAEVPFVGGLAGAFAYDLGRQIERVPTLAKNELDVPDLVCGLYYCPLIIDHQTKTVRLYNFFERSETFKSIQAVLTNALQSASKPETKPEKTTNPFSLKQSWTSNLSKQEYAKKFDRVKAYIRSGDCYQINLAQRFSVAYEGDEWEAYKRLRHLNRAPFSGFLNFASGCLMSLSPERFIEVNNQQVLTQPIKGTRPRGKTLQEDEALKLELQTSEKDQAENLMIVDLLRNDLGRTAIAGSVNVSELFGVYSFPSVHHLISTVRSEIDDTTSSIDVLKSAFPGGSITGAPKIRAMEIIEELEPHRRHFYCGSMAYFSFNGKMDSNILIRSLITTNGRLYAWAGGGLVNDSECEPEYQETFAKLSKILEPLTQA